MSHPRPSLHRVAVNRSLNVRPPRRKPAVQQQGTATDVPQHRSHGATCRAEPTQQHRRQPAAVRFRDYSPNTGRLPSSATTLCRVNPFQDQGAAQARRSGALRAGLRPVLARSAARHLQSEVAEDQKGAAMSRPTRPGRHRAGHRPGVPGHAQPRSTGSVVGLPPRVRHCRGGLARRRRGTPPPPDHRRRRHADVPRSMVQLSWPAPPS